MEGGGQNLRPNWYGSEFTVCFFLHSLLAFICGWAFFPLFPLLTLPSGQPQAQAALLAAMVPAPDVESRAHVLPGGGIGKGVFGLQRVCEQIAATFLSSFSCYFAQALF